MRILFLGDIFGKKGREIVKTKLSCIKKKNNIDFVIANAENAAHGKGITSKIHKELINAGVDCITLGNHAFSKSEILESIDNMDQLVTPYNHKLPAGLKYLIRNINGFNLCVVNILGQTLMGDVEFSQYQSMNDIFNVTKKYNVDGYFVDFHAETTSEKRLFAEYYKNKLVAVCGTHTHVQTADERIIGNLAFISDVGMCGPYDSVIGCDIDTCIDKYVYNIPKKFSVSESDAVLCAVIIDIDTVNKKATAIERIQIRPF